MPEQTSNGQDTASSDLILRVGARVRAAREQKRIPRRVLSEISGVSPRYLAQLEAGAGNISIGLLQKVAQALGQRMEWLLSDDDPVTSEAMMVAGLYRSASPEIRQTVMQMLQPKADVSRRGNRICLVGLRGAGKSTLGALAGEAIGLPFVELNDEIEAESGIPVDELMALYGHEGYRSLEAQAIDRVIAAHDNLILAVAGGIVAEPETYATLLDHFHTIWLKATPGEHMARVRAQGDERPMAGNPAAMDQLTSILTSREALYRRASAQLDTSGRRPRESLADLLNLIEERGFLGSDRK